MTTPVEERREVLEALHANAVEDAVRAWSMASSADLSSAEFQAMILDAIPELAAPYEEAAAEYAASWYDDAAPELPYRAQPAAPAPREQVVTAVDWALGASGDQALDRIAGTLQRLVWNGARRTTTENAAAETGGHWARTASMDACAFCRVLAARGTTATGGRRGVYTFETVDFKAHDSCRCLSVEVRPGRSYVAPEYVRKWDREYYAAVDATRSDPSEPISIKAVLAHMRETAGSR